VIQKDIRILHGVNGSFHIIAFIVLTYFYNLYFGITVLIEARLFFDVMLNLFRKRGIGYVAEYPKSIVDKIEKFIFGSIYSIYLLVQKKNQSLIEGWLYDSSGKYYPSNSYSFIVGILPKIIYLILIIVLNIFYIH